VNNWTDQQLLQDYAGSKSETAFAELVRRHVDFAYSTALRLVCDSHLAQDVTQGVFVALAQNARQLTEHPVLSGWLHRTTRNLAANIVRSETRRRAREQEAAAMNQLSESDATWEIIAPHLDEALGELTEEDRDALLLRYFEKKSGREMAGILGTSEDAAKKRVSRAVERLRETFSKRRVTIGAGGLAVLISANAVQSAPIGLAATISAAVVMGTAVQTSSLVAITKTIAMTTLQKGIIVAALVTAAGTGLFAEHQNSKQRGEIQSLQQQQAPLSAQVEQLAQERDAATNQLANLLAEEAQWESNSNEAELLRLRGQVTQLENSQRNSEDSTTDPTASAAKTLVTRVNQLKQWLEQHPNEKIPELHLLSANDWLQQASNTGDLATDEDFVHAASKLRSFAKQRFAQFAGWALDNYITNNDGQLPDNLSQLEPYLDAKMDSTILQRYQLAQSGNLSDLPQNEPIITEKSPVDEEDDTLFQISATGYSYKSKGSSPYVGGGDINFSPNTTALIQPFVKKN
jgi:RNA polymerase sigma factor (sigma-70 family)